MYHCISESRRGNGCDGIDNNCDSANLIDECAEDTTPPDLDLSSALESCVGKVFQDEAEAIACVDAFMEASDDCQEIKSTFKSTLNEVTCEARINVKAREKDCDKVTIQNLMLKVDDTPPEVRCSIENNMLSNKGVDSYEDIGFTYAVIDNCDAEVDVKIEVFSNEVDLTSGAVLIAKEGNSIYVRNYACAKEE